MVTESGFVSSISSAIASVTTLTRLLFREAPARALLGGLSALYTSTCHTGRLRKRRKARVWQGWP